MVVSLLHWLVLTWFSFNILEKKVAIVSYLNVPRMPPAVAIGLHWNEIIWISFNRL